MNIAICLPLITIEKYFISKYKCQNLVNFYVYINVIVSFGYLFIGFCLIFIKACE